MINNFKKRMLITGASGLLGNNLAYCLKSSYDILGTYLTHAIEIRGIRTSCVDLTDEMAVSGLISKFDPEIIVHCAAQADVDVCEVDPKGADRINVIAIQNLVRSLKGRKIKLISVSTDLVYDGVKGNFSEEDKVNPLNHYGRMKCRGEEEALKADNALVFRTNFFGWHMQTRISLGEWVIRELSQKNEIQGFTDCVFSSIYTFELAKLLDLAIKKDLSGIYNCASSTSMSKYDFAVNIAVALGFDKNLIKAISVDDFDFEAKRAKNLSLDTSKLAKDLAIDIPSIEHSIDCFVDGYKNNLPQIIKSNISTEHYYPDSLDIIPYGRQSIDDDDIAAVVNVLKSRTITQGNLVQDFESALCRVTGASYAKVVNSGTSALHIACLASGVGPGDEVITSPNTFVASANCVAYCGGKPVFADIDPSTYNVSSSEIENKINERTKAVIVVHFAGQSCDMEAIQKIVKIKEKKYGRKIYIIEDACHALGSTYKDTLVGSCSYSDMVTLSFHPVKHITTGEGGAVLSNSSELQKKLGYFRSHGITSNSEEFLCRDSAFSDGEASVGEPIKNQWYYEQVCLGYNYRITEFQCALGLSQLKKLDRFKEKRCALFKRYNDLLKNTDFITTPFVSDLCAINPHLYVILLDFERIGISRTKLMIKLRENKIQTQVHYIPVHTQPFYRNNFGTKWGDCPAAEEYYEECLSIPLYPAMNDGDVIKVVSNIKRLINKPSLVNR